MTQVKGQVLISWISGQDAFWLDYQNSLVQSGVKCLIWQHCDLCFCYCVNVLSYSNNHFLYRKDISYHCVYDDPDLGAVALSELQGHPKQLSVDTNIRSIRAKRASKAAKC